MPVRNELFIRFYHYFARLLVDIATQALEKYNIEKDIAAYIKKEFDKKYNPTWHW
jgi:hypothetical protein